MKETKNIKQKNIENLTSLWKTAGVQFDGYHQESEFEYSEVKGTQWPNRLWFNNAIQYKNIEELKIKLETISSNITIPVWGIHSKSDAPLLEANGFKIKFEQLGMSLKLDTRFKLSKGFKLVLVSNIEQANLWADLFEKSFGYIIGGETVIKTMNAINYYIAFDGNKAVGTALTYETENVIGAHSVGIPPEQRRCGYAEQIMKALINKAVKQGNDYMVLQASDMGKGLYLKLGFKPEFIIKNYVYDECQ